MDNKYDNKKITDAEARAERERTKNDVDGRYSDFVGVSDIPGINTPGVELPAYNPPVPNRAWTAMRMGKDIDQLTEEEKQELNGDMYH